jgi:hypothetical protein
VEVLECRQLLSAPTTPGVQIDGPVTLGSDHFTSQTWAPVGDPPLTFQSDGSPVRFSAMEEVVNYNAINGEVPHLASLVFAVDGQRFSSESYDVTVPFGAQVPVSMDLVLRNPVAGSHNLQIYAATNDGTPMTTHGGILYSIQFHSFPNGGPSVQIDGPETLGSHHFNSNPGFAAVGDTPLTFQSDGSPVRFSAVEEVVNIAADKGWHQVRFEFAVDGLASGQSEVDVTVPAEAEVVVPLDLVLPSLSAGTHNVAIWASSSDGATLTTHGGSLYSTQFHAIPNVGPSVQIDGPETLGSYDFNSNPGFAAVGDTPLTLRSDGSPVRFSAVEKVINVAADKQPHQVRFEFAVDGLASGQSEVDVTVPAEAEVAVPLDLVLPSLSAGTHNVAIWASSSDGTYLITNGGFLYSKQFHSFPVNPGILQFSASTYSVTEGGSATVMVTRTDGSDGAVTVGYATTTGGTAVAGTDYTPTSGTLTFAPGQATQTLTVPILDDGGANPEGNEKINLALSNPTDGATLGTPSSAVLTILDNESPPQQPLPQQPLPQQPPQITDVTGAVSVVPVNVKYSPRSGITLMQLMLRNVSGQPIQGPLYLVLVGLGRKIRHRTQTGVSMAHRPGSSYVALPVAQLLTGQEVLVTLRFSTARARHRVSPSSFVPEVLAGVGLV